MTISSRTPEGYPSRCPLCNAQTNLEYSEPVGDAPCPRCCCLLWRSNQLLSSLQQKLADILGVTPNKLTAGTSFTRDLGFESLDAVEWVLELEEEFQLSISEADAAELQTIGDVIRYLISQERRQDHP